MNKISAKYKECLFFYDWDLAFSAETEGGNTIIGMAIPDGKLDKDLEKEGHENSRDYYYMAFLLDEDVAADYHRGSMCLRSAIDHPATKFYTCDQCFCSGEKGERVEFVSAERPEERDLPDKGVFSDFLSWITIEKKEEGV